MNNQANTAEDFLRSNNLALWSVFDKGQIGLTTIDPDFRFLEMNEAFCRMMGYSKQELNRLTIQDITHPHYIEKDIESMNKLMKGEIKVYKTEKRYIRKDHSTSCGAVTMTAIHNKNGEFLYFLALIEDISERKHAEIALSESEKRLRLLLKNSMDAIFLATPDGNIIEVNTVACELFGYAEEEFKQITRYDILDQSDPRLAAAIDERSQKGKFRGEFTGIKKDGTKFPIEMSTSLFNDHHENPLVSVIIRDFTKSKQAEQALKASEESYRNLFDDNPLMIFTLDTQGIVRDVNKAAAQQLGYKINELIGKPIFHIYHKDSREAVSLQFNGLLQNPEQTYKWEQRKVNKKGNIIWVKETAKVLFPANGDTTVVIMCEDITSLKEAEEGQIETQRLLSISQRLAHIGSWETELSTGKLSWSDEMYRILGFPVVSLIYLDMALSVFQPEELARFNKAISSALKGDVPYNIDYTIIRHDGQVRIIHDEGEVVFDEHGTALRMFGATQDITERKNAENLLQKSEARLNLALQSASMGVWHLDIIEGRRYFDDQVCYLLGINPATFTGAEDEFYEVVHPEDNPTIKAELARTIETDMLYEPEYRAVWPDKSVHYISARGRLYRDDKGAPVRINGIIWDITERKRAAAALQKSEEKYRTIFENVQDVFYQADISGIIREISPSISNFSEFNRDDIIGTSATDLYYNPDDRQTLLNAIMKNGEIRDYEVKFKTKTGEIRHVSINARLIADANGRSNHIDGAIRDVTQRKLAEEALRLSEERYRFSLEITGQIGWSTPPDGLVEDMPLWRQYSGQSIEELKRWKWLDSIHPDDREHANKAWANAVAQKCKYETE